MPWTELLLYLALNGDALAGGVNNRDEGRLTTEHGHVYVRSREGMELHQGSNGPEWHYKFLWCRV